MLAVLNVVAYFVGVLLFRPTDAQNSTAPAGCSEIVDVIFIIDSSLSVRESCPLDAAAGSVPRDNWQSVLELVSETVGGMSVDGHRVRVGVVTYSTSVDERSVIQLTACNSSSSVRQRVQTLPFIGGNTNTSGAIRYARQMFTEGRRGSTRKQLAVLITDGIGNIGSDPVQETRLLKQDGVLLYTVGVSDYIDEAELKEMASPPVSYSYFYAKDFSHLNLLVGQLLDRLVCSNPPPTLPCRDSRADIAFVLDASGSIVYTDKTNQTIRNYYNWDLMKSFVITLIRNLNISADDTHVALIRFSYEADVIFTLDRYTNPAQVIEVVQNMSIVASSTNTSGALHAMRKIVFSAEHGDRPDVHNVGIVITDGQSDNASSTAEEALAAKNEGIRMFAIGLTNEIDVRELTTIASQPLNQHYFNRTSISLVNTVTSQLLWSVCHDPCQISNNQSTEQCQTPSAARNLTTYCPPNRRVDWTAFPGHLLLGHNYATLEDISSLSLCQGVCLQDLQCRSIEYIASLQQCAISYFVKAQAPDSFRTDTFVDYYEVNCV